MRSESIKSILRSYLRGRQHSSVYDDVDGYPFGVSAHLSGESTDCCVGKAGVFPDFEPQMAVIPLDEELDYEPLEAEMEEIAAQIGRQLSELSDDFESDHADAIRNQGLANGSRSVHFREHITRVSPNGDRVAISLVREGPTDGIVDVEWRTCDKNAKAGLHYVYNSGNVIFLEGEEEKIIQVEIVRGQTKKTDIGFAVELFDAEGTFNTLMVYIVDESRMYPEERQVVENIFNCNNISVSEIATLLSDSVTHKTFKAALLCLSSTANSIPKELALGSELLRLSIPHARLSTLANIFCDYYNYLPELEDVAELF